MPREQVRFALAQCRGIVGDETTDPRPLNLRTATQAIERAAAGGAEVVVFGEMFLTGVRTDHWLPRWAVRPDDPTDPTLTALAPQCARHGITVITGTATLDQDQVCRNSVVLVGPDGGRRVYHKRHLAHIVLPDGHEADEAEFYRSGDLPALFEFEWGVLGVQICYEVTIPEAARCAVLDGADVVLNCTASLSGTEEVWAAMARARAFENAVPFVVCSVVGDQGADRYFGGSAAFDSHGRPIVQAPLHEEALVLVDIPVGAGRRTRQEMNIVGARRPELYGSLVEPNREAS